MQKNEAYGVVNMAPSENIYDEPVFPEPEIKEKEKRWRFQVAFLCLVLIFAVILVALAIIIALATNLGQLSGVTCNTTDTNTTIEESTCAATEMKTEPTAQKSNESAPTASTTAIKTPSTTAVISLAVSENCGDLDWRQVAFINMTDQTQHCPQGLNETAYSIRSCGRPASGNRICYSVHFYAGYNSYSKVCGRVLAYRFGHNIGYYGYHYNGHGLNEQYVDGISLTHGTGEARTHIWTFVSGLYQSEGIDQYAHNCCPCDPGNTYSSPPFVENDYFCESVTTNTHRFVWGFYPDNALWDGQGCESNNNCCQFNNPPWFKKVLANSTTENIELRLCFHHDLSISKIAIKQLEIYVAITKHFESLTVIQIASLQTFLMTVYTYMHKPVKF